MQLAIEKNRLELEKCNRLMYKVTIIEMINFQKTVLKLRKLISLVLDKFSFLVLIIYLLYLTFIELFSSLTNSRKCQLFSDQVKSIKISSV